MTDDREMPTCEDIERWRAMSPAETLRISGELWKANRDKIVRDVHREHPDWTQTRIDAEILARFYPDDITPQACRTFALQMAMRGHRWPVHLLTPEGEGAD